MKDLLHTTHIAKVVRDYVQHEGKTLIISQGKMLKDDEMPDDIKELLQTG